MKTQEKPTMSKEYKAELKALLKSKKQLEKDAAKVHRECSREIAVARRMLNKIEKDACRRSLLATKRTTTYSRGIDRRIAIIEGRLS